ncbi:MAG TPA: T9SS type A sorting domain-containing protein, partial [Chryseosolibacter sp.]|nr:T9SS type A sorting domain-containing protein [Chryseosolibacter sp.]
WKYELQTGIWTNVTPAGFGGAFGGISVDPQNSSRLLASSLNTWMLQDGGYGDRIFLSDNGGTSWTDVVSRGFDLDPNGISWIDGSTIHWAGSVEFDPFDTKKAWIISGNGVFQTDDIDAATNVWKFQVTGLEETVPLDMISVSNGPVVSAIGDYGGFMHMDVAEYAPAHSPHMGTTYGLAVASLNPKVMLRIGEEKMYYSEDGALTWTLCNRTGSKGSVAISADGKVMLHTSESSSTIYRSVDKGNTWTPASGISLGWAKPVADPVNAQRFYVYNPGTGKISISSDGGMSFTSGGTAGIGGSKIIRAAPGVEGEIWVPLYGGGLARSIDSGQTFAKINNVTYCTSVGFGKEAKGSVHPTVFVYGRINGVVGIHRSSDRGSTWVRVNDDAHEYGGPGNGQFVQGDMNVFGRVYMSTAGRGIVYGESNQSCLPAYLVPEVAVNSELAVQSTIASVASGSTVRLTTDAPAGGGWSWTGPDGFTSSGSETVIDNIQPEMSGVYTLRYTNASGCESGTVYFSVSVSETVAGAGRNLEGRVDVYPNPSGDSVKIRNAGKVTVVHVRSADGRIAQSIVNGGGDFFELSLRDFAAGVYVLEFIDVQNKTIGMKKIVRQP